MPIINMVYKKKKWWKPWENTIAYYPLNWDANDYSGNNRNLTANNITYQDITSGEKSAYFNGSSSYCEIASQSIWLQNFTMNLWVRKSRNTAQERFMSLYNPSPDYELWTYTSTANIWNVGSTSYIWRWNSSSWQWGVDTWTANWTWMNIVLVWDSTWNKIYKDGVLQTLSYSRGNSSSHLTSSYSFTKIFLWRHNSWGNYFQWNLSNCILENKARTADEILAYYNQTKWNYGL